MPLPAQVTDWQLPVSRWDAHVTKLFQYPRDNKAKQMNHSSELKRLLYFKVQDWKGHALYVNTVTKTPFVSAECLKEAISLSPLKHPANLHCKMRGKISLLSTLRKFQHSISFILEGSLDPETLKLFAFFSPALPPRLQSCILLAQVAKCAVLLHTSEMNMTGTSKSILN